MAMATRDVVLTAPVRGRFLGARIRSASANVRKSRTEISVFASTVYGRSSNGREDNNPDGGRTGRFSRHGAENDSLQRSWKNPRPILPSKPFTPKHPRRDEHGNVSTREYSTFAADVGSSSSQWSRKHLEEQEQALRVRPPRMPRQHLELPSPKYPNRLQQGFASRGVQRLVERPSYELPFEFQYSYSEVPKQEPIAERGPQFSPFGPDSMPRPWTGKRPLPPSRKKHHEIDSFNPPPPDMKGVKPVEPAGPFLEGQRPVLATTREEVLGDPLTPEEIADLVVACNKEHRLVNLGRDGLTHNMLDLIHNHWKRRRVIKLRCKGVPTVDMDNVCFHLEDKTGGKIIRRQGGCVYLFRGRNYNPKFRPHIPLMLWKPPVPIYPRLIEQAPAGLSLEHAEYLRRRGRQVKPLTTLSRNGVYLSLAKDVKSAFEIDELVKIDCKGMNSSDIRKIGAKLKEVLGIVLLSFERECILMWRGPEKRTEDDKALEQFIFQSVSDGIDEENSDIQEQKKQQQNGGPRQDKFLLRSAQELDKLWEKAINFGMVVNLEDDQLDADTVKTIAGGPVKVVRPLTMDEEEEAEEQRKYEEYKRNQERQVLDKRLASPLVPSSPVGHLPVDELAKLLSSPP